MSADLTPAELSMRGSLGANAQWARCDDRTARTAAARKGFYRRFEKQVDPEGVLAPEERVRRAENARKAHMLRLSLLSARARRARAGGDAA